MHDVIDGFQSFGERSRSTDIGDDHDFELQRVGVQGRNDAALVFVPNSSTYPVPANLQY